MARRWTAREDAGLTRLYRSGVPVREIAERLARSEDAVNSRRRHLGLAARRERARWSSREDALLTAASASGLSASFVAERLGRPAGQIRWRRRALGLTSAPSRLYSAEDDEALRLVLAREGSLELLARRLGRTPDALRLRASKLGLYRPVRRRRWTPSEDAAIRDGYDSGLTCRAIARGLPGRSSASVTARAGKLGLATHARRWTPADDRRLVRLAVSHPIDELSRLLGRTPDALRQRARGLGIRLLAGGAPARSGTRWTMAEDELLRLHAGLNPATLARLLDRSDRAVTIRLSALGLRAGREHSPHHRVPRLGQLTPGEQAVLEREPDPIPPRRRLALARRLSLPSEVLIARASAARPRGRTKPMEPLRR